MNDLIFIPETPIDPKLKRAQSLVGTSEGRPEHDFYHTPPEATEALLKVEKFVGEIWEPACGDGSMSLVFLKLIITKSNLPIPLTEVMVKHRLIFFLPITKLPISSPILRSN